MKKILFRFKSLAAVMTVARATQQAQAREVTFSTTTE